MSEYELIIIGGGPAGLAAGIQAGHWSLRTLLIEENTLGGRLLLARKVENFAAINPKNAAGKRIAQSLIEQAMRARIDIRNGYCSAIDYRQGRFLIETADAFFPGKAVILATGVRPKRLMLPGATVKAVEQRLFYSWLDLPRPVSGKKVLVIGGGEVAFDQACSLAGQKALVSVAVRGASPRACPSLVDEARKSGITISFNTAVTRLAANDHALIATVLSNGNEMQRSFDYGLIAIGAVPQQPAITAEARAMKGAGLFWAGDVVNGDFRQAAIAFGDGIKQAMRAYEIIRGEKTA